MTAPALSPVPGDPDWTPGNGLDARNLRATLGAFPSGVTIVTTTTPLGPIGLTVSSFASVSIEPPLLLVCLARTAGSLRAFRPGKALSINVLAAGQSALATRFASAHENRFADIPHTAGPLGTPVLDGVAATFCGVLERIYDAGDHVILLTQVVHHNADGRSPLLYHRGTMHDWHPAAPTIGTTS